MGRYTEGIIGSHLASLEKASCIWGYAKRSLFLKL